LTRTLSTPREIETGRETFSSPTTEKMKINVNSIARKVEVDNRIPLRNYYRIADNLLKQVPPILS
jgi:hypothetical protein